MASPIECTIEGVLTPSTPHCPSLNVSFALNQRSQASIRIDSPNDSWTPETGVDINIFYKGIKIFGGLIWSVKRKKLSGVRHRVNDIQAVGYEWLFDRRSTGARSYTNQYASDIFLDIIYHCINGGDGADGVIVSEVAAGFGPLVESITFDNETVSEAFNKLSELTQLRWLIDVEKRLQVFDPDDPQFTNQIVLNHGPGYDNSDNTLVDTFEVTETLEQFANRVVVTFKDQPVHTVESFSPSHPSQPTDGVRQRWTLEHSPLSGTIGVEVDGSSQTISVAGGGIASDWYYTAGGVEVFQKEGATPLSGSQSVAFNYWRPDDVTVTAANSTDISTRATKEQTAGIHERKIENAYGGWNLQFAANSILDGMDEVSRTFSWEGNFEDWPWLMPGFVAPMYVNGDIAVNALIRSVSFTETSLDLLRVNVVAVSGPLLKDGFQSFSTLGSSTSIGSSKKPDPVIPPQPGGDLPEMPGDIAITGAAAVYYVENNQTIQVNVPYSPPSPLNGFDRVHLYIQKNGGPIQPVAQYPYRSGDTHFSIWQPVPKVLEQWRIYAIAGSPLQERPFHKYDEPNPSPNVLVNVAPFGGGSTGGIEYFPLLVNFDSVMEYSKSDSGARLFRLKTSWDNPAYPALGCAIYMKWDDWSDPLLVGRQADTGNPHVSDWWELVDGYQGQNVRIYGVTWGDPNDRENTIENGVTPYVDITCTHPDDPPVIRNDEKITLIQIEPGAIGTTLSTTGGVLDIKDGAVDLAKFAAGVEPVTPVSATPLTKITEVIYNTTTRQILRWNGTAYVRTMSGTDIKAELFIDKITAGEISAAAITAVAIAAGAITSDKLASNWIDVGGGGTKPGQFRVFNASAAQIAWIGVNGSDAGGWFRTLGVGGSSFTNAPLKADSSGNLSITNAAIDITGSGLNRILMSTAVLGLQVQQSSSSSSRFQVNYSSLEAYYSGLQTIILQSGSGNGELGLYNAGSVAVTINSGGSKIVRADGGFSVSGIQVINSSRQWVGASIPIASGGTGGTDAASARLNLAAMHWFGHYNTDPGPSMPNDAIASWWTGSQMYLVLKNSGNKFRAAMNSY